MEVGTEAITKEDLEAGDQEVVHERIMECSGLKKFAFEHESDVIAE